MQNVAHEAFGNKVLDNIHQHKRLKSETVSWGSHVCKRSLFLWTLLFIKSYNQYSMSVKRQAVTEKRVYLTQYNYNGGSNTGGMV